MENYLQSPKPSNAVQAWPASSSTEVEVSQKRGGCLTMLSVDLPEDVALTIYRNGFKWFKSDGNEKGTMRFCGIPFEHLRVIIDNANATDQVGHVRLVYHT